MAGSAPSVVAMPRILPRYIYLCCEGLPESLSGYEDFYVSTYLGPTAAFITHVCR